MNKKTTSFKKLLPKIALALAVLMVMICALSSCGSQTVIDTNIKAEQWAEKEANLTLEKNWLGHVLSWIGIFLGWISKVMPANSYILTLFVFAIIMEIVLLPFSVKQQKNSIKQARLKPYEMAIRKKYAGRKDQATQQKVTQEIQELYAKENFNPMAGCLPLLIQLPILIVLYWIVVDPIQYVLGMSGDLTSVLYTYITSSAEQGGLGLGSIPTNGSIAVLSKVKELGIESFEGIKTFCQNGEAVYAEVEKIVAAEINFNVGPLNLGLKPEFDFSTVNAWLLLIPVVTFFVYFFSMKINRKLQFQPTQSADDRQQACSNNMMDVTMPLMSVFITFGVPAAVGVYWIFKSIIGVGKQFIMSKVMPMPKFTEDDFKAAEKEMLGKQPKKITKSENVGKVRSLHHIDDEDYDDNGNYNPQPVVENEEAEEAPNNTLPENSMTEGATLKDESDKRNGKN